MTGDESPPAPGALDQLPTPAPESPESGSSADPSYPRFAPDRPFDDAPDEPVTPRSAASLTTFRERLSAATPLLLVSAGCFALGAYLRWTANVGPAPAFPIWTLFFALGLVASLGGGFFLVVEPEEDALIVASPTRRRAPTKAASFGARPPSPRVSLGWDRRPASPLAATAVAASPDAYLPDVALPPMTPTVAVGPEPPPPVPAREVLAELDRVISDLRPARLNRPLL